MAGGVALNCVGNGRIIREGPFDHVWIQPAAGDAGGALGVALGIWHRYLDKPRASAESTGTWQRRGSRYADAMKGSFLGPASTDDDVAAWLTAKGLRVERRERRALADEIAALLADGKVIGLVQGRMEFGRGRSAGARLSATRDRRRCSPS
jgi:carbamoyltransferase